MTENQWPQDGSYASPAATEQMTGTPQSTLNASPGADTASTTEKVKEEAGNVAGQAADAAGSVVETARQEAATVATEVKSSAKDLLVQAKSDLTDQAATQQQKVASGLRSISEELHSMASAAEEPGVATDLVRQAAERSSSMAQWLDGRDPGSLLDEVKSFARQRPGTFLLLAAGAGVLAGRLTRGLTAGGNTSNSASPPSGTTGTPKTSQPASVGYEPAAGTAVPPPPVELPGPGVTTAGYGATADDVGGPGYPYGTSPDPGGLR
ncbi:hypothetical protein AB6813_11890 [bacterium RCC_150]